MHAWGEVCRGPDIKQARRFLPAERGGRRGRKFIKVLPIGDSASTAKGAVREVIKITLLEGKKVEVSGGGGRDISGQVSRKGDKKKRDGRVSGGDDLLRLLKSVKRRGRSRTNSVVEMTPMVKKFEIPTYEPPISKLRVEAPMVAPVVTTLRPIYEDLETVHDHTIERNKTARAEFNRIYSQPAKSVLKTCRNSEDVQYDWYKFCMDDSSSRVCDACDHRVYRQLLKEHCDECHDHE